MKLFNKIFIIGFSVLTLTACGNEVETMTNQISEMFGKQPSYAELAIFANENNMRIMIIDEDGELITSQQITDTSIEVQEWSVDEVTGVNGKNLRLIKTIARKNIFTPDEQTVTEDIVELDNLEKTKRKVESWLEGYDVSGGFFEADIAMFTYDTETENDHFVTRIIIKSTLRSGLRTEDEMERAMNNLAVNLAEQEFGISRINITVQENNSSTNNLLRNSAFSEFLMAETDHTRVVMNYIKFSEIE